jgi:hypothetical protein
MQSRQPIPSALRWPTAAALLVAAAAHVPVTPEHLREAPYMGWLFVGFTVITAATALLVAVRATPPMTFVVAGVVCATAIAAYCLTRLIAFPQLADDVGNWGEPLGLLSIASEAVVVALCVATGQWLRRRSDGATARATA